MKTLTMKEPTNDTRLSDFKPSIPAFMEASGTCAILFRDSRDLCFTERWVRTSGYVTEAIEANDLEVERYIYSHDADELLFIDDLPEPIACHDADLWEDCVEPDMDDYELVALQYENATRLVA